MAEGFEELVIWQQAHKLTLGIYALSGKWPKSELYGLTSQIRRAAISVELNIAEGHSRYHYGETINFMYNARGSAQEVRNCLLIAKDLKEINVDEEILNKLNDEYLGLIKGINGFVKFLKTKKSNYLVN